MTTPLDAPNSAGMATALARAYAVQIDINHGTVLAGTPDWRWILGLNKVNPTNDITFQDNGDIHSRGRKSSIATAIGENLELGGLRKGNRSPDYVPDPGQEKLRSHGEEIGDANTAHIRYWRTDEIAEAKEGYFAVNWVSSADDKEGLLAFTATCTGQGQHANIAKPMLPVVKTFTLPAGTTAGTWTATVDGDTATGIAHGVTAAAFKTALEALASVGTGGVTSVTGTPLTGLVVTFAVPVTTVTASGTGLTPTGTVTVA
ncbi:phage tail tube protein [Nocardia salmonicida]|uniref:phage tail tube protein n=1 Tax=Nocardia salmonicida TaxID=53431 RepID=UPI0036377DAB